MSPVLRHARCPTPRAVGRSTLLRTLGIALGLATLAACHHAQPVVAARPIPANADSLRLARARADSIARAEAARRDSIARADSLRRAGEAMRIEVANARRTLTTPIHFAFDRSEIESGDRALLDQKAAILTANHSVQLRIEGNADERGSDEYNLALGMRRASEARRYLTERRIDSTRLAIASNGEERPVCQTHEESCWAQNRRDAFVITSGGDRIAMRR